MHSQLLPTAELQPAAGGFERGNALVLSRLCSLAYFEKKEDVKKALDPNFRLREMFSVNELDGIIVTNEEAVVIAFRGTEPNEIYDWIMTDFRTELISTEDLPGRTLTVKPEFTNILKKVERYETENNDNPRYIVVTGHSLGGALAILFAALARGIGPASRDHPRPSRLISQVYTFGAPRCGDDAFANAYDGELRKITHRVVNDRDLAATVPPAAWGYSHVGRIAFLTDEKGEVITGTAGQLAWERRSDRTRLFVVGNMLDHYLGENYIGKFLIHIPKGINWRGYIEKIEDLPSQSRPSEIIKKSLNQVHHDAVGDGKMQ